MYVFMCVGACRCVLCACVFVCESVHVILCCRSARIYSMCIYICIEAAVVVCVRGCVGVFVCVCVRVCEAVHVLVCCWSTCVFIDI